MALVNVDELMGDPDFFDDVFITRYARTVGANGRTVDTGYDMLVSAQIAPANNQQIEQIPEASRLTTGSNISLITAIPLIALSEGNAGDVVQWRGRSYRVLTVNDYSNYGLGFYQATAQLLELTDTDPET